MLWMVWACAPPAVEGWMSGDLPQRDSIISYEEEHEQLFGGVFGEFSVVTTTGFSSGRGGFTVLRMGEEEEFLCGLNYEIDFVSVASDCSACDFSFAVYEHPAQMQGEPEYCSAFAISTEDVGDRNTFIGYGAGQAFRKTEAGEWEAFGVAEYRESTQFFSYYDVQESP